MSLGAGPEAPRVQVRWVSASLFPTLGVRPALGRFFGEAEDRAGTPGVVLGHGLWRRHFGGDPAILGRAVPIEGRPFTVVGVAPPGFSGAELEPVELWAPMGSQFDPPLPDWRTTRDAKWVRVVGRLAPGATPERVAAEITPVERAATSAMSDWEGSVTMSALPLWYGHGGSPSLEVAVSRWLLGVAGVVLLVACANVANLLLARAVRRRREVAVRLALGIGRARLVRLLVAEGMLLAAAGGVAGLLLAWWGGQLLRVTLLENVPWGSGPVDGRVLLLATALTLVTGLVVSLLPALQASRPALATSLKAGTPQAGGARSRLRGALTVAQAALSVVLLVGAGLFVLSLQQVRTLRLGLDADRVLLVELSWPRLATLPEALREGESARRLALRRELHERLRTVAGVAGAALSVGTPFHSGMGYDLRVDGVDSLPALPGGGPYVSLVSADYFATAGTRVLRGRGFLASDREGAERVAVVNATMARVLWPAGDAIGKCLFVGDPARTPPCARVVGVVEDVHRFELREEPAMQYYLPLEQGPRTTVPVTLVRAAGDPAALTEAIRRHVVALEPGIRRVNVQVMQDIVAPQMRPWRLGAVLFGLFGALALLVAAVGLYSVMSYGAAQRTHEMGVRMALGARPGDVRRLVLRSGLALAALGVALGLLGAVAGGRWAEPLLFETSPRDPLVLGGVALALLAVALVASLVPAWRASRVAPSVALRAE